MLQASDLQWLVGYQIGTSRPTTPTERSFGLPTTSGGAGVVVAVTQTDSGPLVEMDWGFGWILTEDTTITLTLGKKER